MIWNKVRNFIEALDRRITNNVAYRGEHWVHDPDDERPRRPPGTETAAASAKPRDQRNAAVNERHDKKARLRIARQMSA